MGSNPIRDILSPFLLFSYEKSVLHNYSKLLRRISRKKLGIQDFFREKQGNLFPARDEAREWRIAGTVKILARFSPCESPVRTEKRNLPLSASS